jgi:hypothetical protein
MDLEDSLYRARKSPPAIPIQKQITSVSPCYPIYLRFILILFWQRTCVLSSHLSFILHTLDVYLFLFFSMCTKCSACIIPFICASEQDQDWTAVPFWSYSQAVSKPVWLVPLLCVQWRTPDDGQRNCPKHVEFHSKHKFEKLVHLLGFVISKDERS